MTLKEYHMLSLWYEELDLKRLKQTVEDLDLDEDHPRMSFINQQNRQKALKYMRDNAGRNGYPEIPDPTFIKKRIKEALAEGQYTQEQRKNYWRETSEPLRFYLREKTGLPRNPSDQDFQLHSVKMNSFMEDHDGTEGYPEISAKKVFTQEEYSKKNSGCLYWISRVFLIELGFSLLGCGCLTAMILTAIILGILATIFPEAWAFGT